MKILFLTWLLVVGYCSASDKPYNVLEILQKNWLSYVEKFELDPLYIYDQNFNISIPEFRGTFQADEIIIEGLSGAHFHHVGALVDPIRLRFFASLDKLSICSDNHKITGYLWETVPFESQKKLRIEYKQLKVSGSALLNSRGQAVIKALKVYVDVGKVKTKLQGVSFFTNQMISWETPSILKRYGSKVVNDILADQKYSAINDIISELSVKEITSHLKHSPFAY